jgi:DHA1 family bicyclomycin/chloramphenicol resistance-like MFS transporter
MKPWTVMGEKRIFLLLVLLSAFPPIATSMYLPAIPLLQKTWHEPLSVLNLTLVGFFGSYCFFLLIFGPISDRFGRRRPLLAGIALFVLSSLMCALTDRAVTMIVLRVLQGAGAAAASSLALAITKDAYEGSERGRVLAYIGTITAVTPMVAPIFGGWILAGFSWRLIFLTQAIFGIVAWLKTWRMAETLKAPSHINFLQSTAVYVQILRNRKYVVLTLMMAAVGVPHFAFIGGSADIYITRFGLSEQVYGYLFAMNASSMMLGALAYSLLLRRVKAEPLMAASFSGILIGGLVMMSGWLPGFWALALSMPIITFSYGFNRPLSHHLILEQVDRNAGAASSLLVFSYFTVGALAMWLIALDWSDKIRTIGISGAVSGGLVLCLWLVFPRMAGMKPPKGETGEAAVSEDRKPAPGFSDPGR